MSEASDDDAACPRGRLRRDDKSMSATEIEDLLHAARCARVATLGVDGYPYAMPVLFVHRNGRIYLHTTAQAGHFLTNVRHEQRVCFEVDEPGEVFPYGPVECDTTIAFRSVIVFGRIAIIEDEREKRAFFSALMAKYAPAGSWGREPGTFPRLDATIVYAIGPNAIAGKQGLAPIPALRP
ncbi:MAG TPA: pyridoxamine 5'-phosphate oxidase family protein [Steroidobacteraceae bacterium]|nr:pyridoxamine 5'-phosphate oxidase family protein [Steroidobacteraceae bacterium]